MRYLLLTCVLLCSYAANAWHGDVRGNISNIHVTNGENFGFRVILEGNKPLCGNEHTWAYLNESDSNYETYVSVLLAARLADRPVTIYSNWETKSGKKHCHIGYIAL
ncbi:hypothetical protein [Vibrio sagamiensis]|uniref:Uncharacterized protein n=1 Tax=Vibrio sagamiensis NBRC 104589 TaxID=1219064 RepID=A0A511QJN4_9VIBR|nr:hypothetical protein [Vibrio sagamiensis]PNQ60474.1 hypothetical protein C1141_11800 [Vibrio agarivorans]GEM77540.1 hypothetical protein VSA01S_36520 [Vibrio sagamiensis NBRC 104589]